MAVDFIIETIQVKRANASAWTTANPTLLDGEIGFERDNNRIKIGNGNDDWNTLSYLSGGGGGGGATQLSDLTDVGTAVPVNRHVLIGDGTDFDSRALTIADISNFGTYATQASQTAQDALIANNTANITTNANNIAINTAKVSATGSINTHSDVNTGSALNGQVLKFNGTQWVPSSDTAATQLVNLTDVVSADNTAGFVLIANGGTGYVGRALLEADISDFGDYLAQGSNTITEVLTLSTGTGAAVTINNSTDVLTIAGGITANTSTLVFGDNTITTNLSLAQVTAGGNSQIATVEYVDSVSNPSLSIDDEGIAVASAVSKLNLVGAGVSAVDAGGGEVTVTISAGGDALTTNSLAQFATTTSAELATLIDDETGNGALVFGTSPILVTPNLGTPSTLVLTNATGLPESQVTQHQASLSITESQISDFGTYITSDTSVAANSFVIPNILGILQADFDALGTPDANTFFLIPDAFDPSVPVANTGSVISLASTGGNYMHMSSASGLTSYTLSGATLGGWAMIRINAASKPAITGSTEITGANFVPSTDMYITVFHNGVTTQHYFIEI